MSKAQHTPGPWSVWKNGQSIDADRYEDGSRHIVAVAQGDNTEEQRGNAVLIAAAPELLEALEDARYMLYGDGLGNPKIDAAIAKAKGK